MEPILLALLSALVTISGLIAAFAFRFLSVLIRDLNNAVRDAADNTHARSNELQKAHNDGLERIVDRLDTGLASFNAKIDTVAQRTDKKIDSLDLKIDTVAQRTDARLDATNARLDATNERIGDLTKTVGRLDGSVGSLESRVRALEADTERALEAMRIAGEALSQR